MINADVLAKAVLNFGPFSHKKLQKICYYVYSWYITIYQQDPFLCYFEAWRHGPVSPEIYNIYKRYGASDIMRYNGYLSVENEFMHFTAIITNFYSQHSANELETLTHSEKPWQKARCGCKPYESCTNEILNIDIIKYYSTKHEIYSRFTEQLKHAKTAMTHF